jgi:hypothetical protein
MKMFYTVLLTLLISNCFSQITKTKTALEKEENIIPYDSLSNISFDNFKSHVGQTLYMNDDKYSKKMGVKGYSLMKTASFDSRDLLEKYIYKYTSKNGFSGSDYNAVTNRYYYVNKLIKDSKVDPIFSNTEKYCFELITQDEVKDTVYYHFDNTGKLFSDFITVGYFEKMKKIYKGKELYFDGNQGAISDFIFKFDTGERFEANIPQNTKFRCTDITIQDGGYYSLIMVLENDKLGKLYTELRSLSNFFETDEEYNLRIGKEIIHKKRLIDKYGKPNAELILAGKVKIGWSKEICQESWGKPETINKTTGSYGVHEQWVYGNSNYLYFENGKLTDIQN